MTALKPIGKTLAEFQPLQPAEQKLLVACRAGEIAEISAQRPTEATPDNTVRAAFLRFMLLGGDERAPVHEKGVQLQGAWVGDELDMRGATILTDVWLRYCTFVEALIFRDASVKGSLALSDSKLAELAGDGFFCKGDLFLERVGISKVVRLLGAQIGGDLTCSGASFDNGGVIDRSVIKGCVFFQDKFIATGEVRLVSVQIGGDLTCKSASFDGGESDALVIDKAAIKGSVFFKDEFIATGEVRLHIAQIAGNLNCQDATLKGGNGFALTGDGMCVQGALFFRNLKLVEGDISLSSAHVGRLVDDKEIWGGTLVLDGFVYDSIAGGAPTDAATRIAWLDKQSAAHAGLDKKGAEFTPQPWRQLIKVLREMGHAEDARQVSIAFEQRLRAANLIGQTPKDWNRFRAWSYRKISRTGHRLFGVLTGYGYRPLRLLAWMVGVWLFCAVLYWCAAVQGVFAPSDPLVFQNEKYEVCAPSYVAPASAVVSPIKGAGNWYLCAALPEEYSGFSPLAYSLDVILPLVNLQQESSWSPLIPTPNKTWYKELFTFEGGKHWTRLLVWFEILFGWVASLLLVAVVSGLTKRREE